MDEAAYSLLLESIDKFNAFRAHNPAAPIDLKGARLERRNLSEANLVNADLSGANLQGADLSNANLMDAVMGGANCRNASFACANLLRAQCVQTDMTGCNFIGARLERANLQNSLLRSSKLTGCIMNFANIENADFSWARLEETHLHATNYDKARISRRQLQGAVMSDIKQGVMRETYGHRVMWTPYIFGAVLLVLILTVPLWKPFIFRGDLFKADPRLGSIIALKLGERFAFKDDTQKAIQQYNLVVKYDPENPMGYLRLAETYSDLGDEEKAAKYYRLFVEKSPKGKKREYVESLLKKAKGGTIPGFPQRDKR